jgi:YD repeat-containing protein
VNHSELPDGRQIEYLYDGFQRRIGKRVNGTLTEAYLFDGTRPIAQLDGAGNIVARFVYASDRNTPSFMIKNGETYRIISDHTGSPRLIIHAGTGAIMQQLDYDEFGNVTTDTNTGFQPFGFMGGLLDADTGLVAVGPSNYDAEVGRTTGTSGSLESESLPDPINPAEPSTISVALVGPVELIFYRGKNLLVVIDQSGNVIAAGEASNRALRPYADPFMPDGNGPAPTGTFPILNEGVCTLGRHGQFPHGFLGIELPEGPDGEREGVGVHGDAERNATCRTNAKNGVRPLYMCGTKGCIRVDTSFMTFLCDLAKSHPIIQITIK